MDLNVEWEEVEMSFLRAVKDTAIKFSNVMKIFGKHRCQLTNK
jgi:hypothetical protein